MTNLDYLYNADDARKVFGKNYFVDKKLHFKIIEHGTILPHKLLYVNGEWTPWGFGGIIDRRGEFVKNSFVRYGAGDAYTPAEEVRQSPATVVYLGVYYPIWGHCITDNLRRLWFLKSDAFKSYFANCPLVYIPWCGGGYYWKGDSNFRRLIEILEVDVDRLQPIVQPIKFQNIILPDEAYFFEPENNGTFFTAEYKETVDRVRDFALKNQSPTSSKKIFYFHGRTQFGEERLAEYFHSKGYEIVSPEKLSLDEQLNLLINAQSFASTLGSSSHNSIFLRDGIETIFIPRAANRFTSGRQDVLDQIRNANAIYVDSSLSVFEQSNAHFCYIISRELKNFFGDEFDGYTNDDLKIFLTYVNACMRGGLKQNNESLKYYGSTFWEFFSALKQRKELTDAYGLNLI